MNFAQQLIDLVAPSRMSCNDPFDTDAFEEQTSESIDFGLNSNVKHRIPTFDHVLDPIVMLTSNMDFVRGFKFDVGIPGNEKWTNNFTWEIPPSDIVEEQKPMMGMMPRVSPKPTFTYNTQLVADIVRNDPKIVMVGKVDGEGKVDAIFVRRFLKNWSTKITAHFPENRIEKGLVMGDLQYESKQTTASFKFGESLNGITGTFGYMHRVLPKLYLGFEIMHLFAAKKSIYSFAGKFINGNHSCYAAFLHGQQVHLGYLIPLQKNFTFVSHFKYDNQEKKTTTIVGLKQKYQSSEVLTTINSRLKAHVQVTLKQAPIISLKLCGMMDWLRDKYSFGFSAHIGPQ